MTAIQSTAERLRPPIFERSSWGDDLPPTGPLVDEDEVRFLLVHHTASGNDYGPDDVVDQIRAFHRFHTGPEKGWPDIAYNFLIDRFGRIWEARAGSIQRPVRGDATGGSQGFAVLCALIGDHSTERPTPEALDALTSLLAWLGHGYGVDTTAGSLVEFESRGSNRWPAGATVTARTISGHREMSQTSCPGDALFDLLDRELPEAVQALRTEIENEIENEVGAGTRQGEDRPTIEVEVGEADGPEAVTTGGVDGSTTTRPPDPTDAAGPITDRRGTGGRPAGLPGEGLAAGVAVLGAALAALIALRTRTNRSPR